ncbi:unnamed protein product, partial [Adineta ricciae]
SNPVKSESNSDQIQSNPTLELDLDLTGIGFGASLHTAPESTNEAEQK